MEEKQIALIRGINVGKAKRIAMADLRTLLEELGCSGVKTVLNSGNAVYSTQATAAESAQRIEAEIQKRFHFSAKVMVITAEELRVIIEQNPLAAVADNPSRLLVAVFSEDMELSKLQPLAEKDWSPDAFGLGSKAAYLWCPEGVLESPVPEALGKLVGEKSTTRNWGTMLKLWELVK